MHLLLALLLSAAPSFAHSDGVTGRSTTGCGSCHGATAASTTTATLSATSTTLAPGARTNVSLRVRTTSTTRTHAGLNVAATGGTLGGGVNTVRSGSELTHSAPQALTAGTINFRFTWRAPTTPGTYTISAAGNAVNNNGASSGDGWRVATPLTMTVASGMVALDESGAADPETLVPASLSAEEFVTLWEEAALEQEEGDQAAGCSALGSGAGLGLSAMGLLPLITRRRRGPRA